MRLDRCEHCGVALSPRFGFGCCDECSERLAREFALEDRHERGEYCECPDCTEEATV